MFIVYCLFVIGIEMFMLSIEFAASVVVGEWYKKRIPQYQMILMGFACFFLLAGAIVSYLETDSIPPRSLFSYEFYTIFAIVAAFFFVGSIYKYINYSKKKNLQRVISLTKDEYQLKSEYNLDLDSVLYTPNIRSFAITEDKILVFSGNRPSNKVDADFICYEIGENIYDCVAFYSKENKLTFLRFVQNIEMILFDILVITFPILLVYTDSKMILGKVFEEYIPIYRFFVLYILGYFVTWFAKNTHGILAVFKVIGKASIILALINFVLLFYN